MLEMKNSIQYDEILHKLTFEDTAYLVNNRRSN